jgi:ubiquinone/menaquinone biosynthesis C-methylase UbiE
MGLLSKIFARNQAQHGSRTASLPSSLDVLVRGEGTPEIWIVSGGARRLIPSIDAFEALGYDIAWVRVIPDQVLAGIPEAPGSARSFDNSVERNREQWGEWDWSRCGEEWTVSPEWKQALIDEVLLRYVMPGKTVLEIGPGGGRWTEVLQRISERLIVVDLTEQAIAVCKRRFAGCKNIEYFVNDGTSLEFLPDNSVDHVWSFDVFVHISPRDIDAYLGQMARVLRPGGAGVIHHAREGGRHGGLRSAMTSELFAEMVRKHGMSVERQFDRWGDHEQHNLEVHRDVITVFRA